jgi:hypothetical protein
MLISPYWDDRLMLEDNQDPHILAIGDSWFWFPKNNLLNPIFLHNYDRAIPTGKGFARLGNWLKEPMVRAHIDTSLQQGIVNRLLFEFTQRLKAQCTRSDQITFVDFARLGDVGRPEDIQGKGTLVSTEWANELHPKPRGFNKIVPSCWASAFAAAGLR